MSARWKVFVFAFFAGVFPVFLPIYAVFMDALNNLAARHMGQHFGLYWVFYVMLVLLAGWVLFLVDAARNPRVPESKRNGWIALLFFGAFWAMPFYWWWYVRPSEAVATVRSGSSAV
ncbi:MAG: hypothetical protein GY769_10915 [bacterium]|nr:hypothetical protein [bacterium]